MFSPNAINFLFYPRLMQERDRFPLPSQNGRILLLGGTLFLKSLVRNFFKNQRCYQCVFSSFGRRASLTGFPRTVRICAVDPVIDELHFEIRIIHFFGQFRVQCDPVRPAY
jgi:hypothetical protein